MIFKSNALGLFTLAVIGAGTGAPAAEYLTEVTSEVFQTAGTPREIAQRASTCISQNLRPGETSAPLITSADLDSGVIVARSAARYPDGLMTWDVRSTVSVA